MFVLKTRGFMEVIWRDDNSLLFRCNAPPPPPLPTSSPPSPAAALLPPLRRSCRHRSPFPPPLPRPPRHASPPRHLRPIRQILPHAQGSGRDGLRGSKLQVLDLMTGDRSALLTKEVKLPVTQSQSRAGYWFHRRGPPPLPPVCAIHPCWHTRLSASVYSSDSGAWTPFRGYIDSWMYYWVHAVP
jgi:hypothetical protein